MQSTWQPGGLQVAGRHRPAAPNDSGIVLTKLQRYDLRCPCVQAATQTVLKLSISTPEIQGLDMKRTPS